MKPEPLQILPKVCSKSSLAETNIPVLTTDTRLRPGRFGMMILALVLAGVYQVGLAPEVQQAGPYSAPGGVSSPHSPLDASTFTEAELRVAVEAAENWGTYVTVHAYTPVSIAEVLIMAIGYEWIRLQGETSLDLAKKALKKTI